MANRVEVGSDGGVFNQIADERHRHRAAYPDALIDRACELAGLAPGARVLEIGCGTGQLTRSLLAWGLRVTAVEPGEQLIARARDRLAGAGEVQFVNARLEEAPLPRAHHRAVFSASAIHWVDPGVSWRKLADALVDGGTLASGWTSRAVATISRLSAPRLRGSHSSSPASGRVTEISMARSPAPRSGTRTCRRRGHGSGATRWRAGMSLTCSGTLCWPRSRYSLSTPPMRSTACWAPCRSGRACRPAGATLSSPRTTPSTSGSAGRSARALWPAW
jgi:SAM-dependent methyltransferase